MLNFKRNNYSWIPALSLSRPKVRHTDQSTKLLSSEIGCLVCVLSKKFLKSVGLNMESR